MLVQDRAVPKSSKQTQIKTLPTIQPNGLTEAKSLDFSTRVSDNLYRLVAICVLIVTVAAVLFLYSSTDTTSLLCLQSQTQRTVDSISVPRIEWNSIKPISDKSSSYATFRSEQSVVVSVSDYPSKALQKMVKIKGWKVLTIGNSKTPKDWSLKGLMVPLNSFNTICHSSTFWALMLPIYVSTMASDVMRGYWGQRLLWDIGGNVVVYPPTVHRYDRIEAYPFSEEKDLHLNVGRLIKFLISWISNKHRLFEKILDLSYAMAEEGFWTEQDLKFTAAWLQDLLAVGYQQPRLMTLELDRPRATIGHGDRKEFIPRKLPSVHLAVEETGTVSSEIGNLIRLRKNFGNIVLIMFCNGPVERTALEWRLLYGRIFKTVVILSTRKNTELAVEEGRLDQIYKHLPKIFDRFSSADGFLFLEDDTVLNYWNLLPANKTKLWIPDKVSMSWTTASTKDSDWHSKQADMVKKVVSTMPVHFQVNYKEVVKNEESLTICSSEIFYIPRSFVADFVDLVNQVGHLDIHQKVAIPMFFLSMDSPQNFDTVLSTMVYKQDLAASNSSWTHYSAQAPAVHPWRVSSEEEFIKLIRIMGEGDPLLMELV